MTTASDATFCAATHYVFLEDGGAAAPIEVNETLYSALRTRQTQTPAIQQFLAGDGWLLTTIDIDADSPRWEVHTLADELLILISGALDVVTEDARGEERVNELRPGRGFILPKGTWHRFITREPSTFVGVAYGKKGQGTVYRPVAAREASATAVS